MLALTDLTKFYKMFLFSFGIILCFACANQLPPKFQYPKGFEELSVPLELIATGEYGCIPIVKVRIKDRILNFIIDTASGYHVVDASLTAALGMKSIGKMMIEGYGGRQQAAIYVLPPLQWQDFSVNNEIGLFVNLSFLREHLSTRIDGILGISLFKLLPITIAFSSQQMVFHFSENSKLDAGFEKLKITDLRSLPSIELNIFGSQTLFIIDSGSSASVMLYYNQNSKTHWGYRNRMLSVTSKQLGGQSTEYLGSLPNFQIARNKFKSVPVSLVEHTFLSDNSKKNVGGTIGCGLLRKLDLLIDYRKKAAFFSFNEEMDEFQGGYGIIFTKKINQIIVKDIIPSSPAADSAIQPGDRLLAVNDVLFTHNLDELWRMVQQMDTMDLEFEGKKRRYNAHLKRRAYLPSIVGETDKCKPSQE